MGGIYGFIYDFKNKEATKTLNGFYGFKITLDLNSVKVTDSRGKGLSDVRLEALNPISNLPFVGYTDTSGSVFMALDESTEIIITKNNTILTVQYEGELSPTYQLDFTSTR